MRWKPSRVAALTALLMLAAAGELAAYTAASCGEAIPQVAASHACCPEARAAIEGPCCEHPALRQAVPLPGLQKPGLSVARVPGRGAAPAAPAVPTGPADRLPAPPLLFPDAGLYTLHSAFLI